MARRFPVSADWTTRMPGRPAATAASASRHAGQHPAVRRDLPGQGRRVPGQDGLELVQHAAGVAIPAASRTSRAIARSVRPANDTATAAGRRPNISRSAIW